MKGIFKTLFIREIQGAIVDFRFWVVLALCVSIIPLSFYVSVKNYSQRLSDYRQEVQTYRDRTGSVAFYMVAEGVHPPSPLSIFSQGIGHKMPYKVLTSNNGDYKIEYAKPENKQDLLGEIDFAFIVAFVLSILAIVFTFSAISGDKESGVLRGILSNAVLRRQFLMAKLFGNYIVFLVPFLLSMLLALLIVYISGIIPIFSKELFPAVLAMTGISLVFLFALFNLGLWISALTRNSILSINVLLLIWIVLGLVIPKISPIIGSVIYPVESAGVFESKIALLRADIEKEQYKLEGDLYETLRALYHPTSRGQSAGSGLSDEWNNLNNAFEEQVKPIREKYEQQIVSETEQLTNDYIIRRNKQNNIARSISMLSPINSINNLLAEFSGTGNSEADNFTQQARQFQSFVKQEVYDKFEVKITRSRGGTSTNVNSIEGFDPKDTPIPVLDNYQHVSAAGVFRHNWLDIALLGFYCLLFFVCGFVSFLRFDVR
jgi:ABC-type transport system involved in multi-copper enzyme maturation permease subunit